MTVYADEVFAVNFISTACMLGAYSHASDKSTGAFRIFCSAAAVGVYSVFEILFLMPHCLRIPLTAAITAAAFGRRNILRNMFGICFFSAMLEVIFSVLMYVAGRNMYVVSETVTVFSSDIFAAGAYAAVYPIFFAVRSFVKIKRRGKKADAVINDAKIRLVLLYDSGNLLRYKGLGVAVVSWDRIKAIYPGKSYFDFAECAEGWIHFGSVGQGGVLPIVTPDKFSVDGTEIKIKIAVAERRFGDFDGLIGEAGKERIKCNL